MPAPLGGTTYVAVVGGGMPDAEAAAVAREVGSTLAARGAIVVCGGLGGVMEAACEGAKEAGGTTLAFLPGARRDDANPFVDIALPTGMGEMRNMLIVRAADAVIAVGGEFGTLSEIAFALRVGRPVVGISTWELVKGGRRSDAIVVASSATEAVDRALALGTTR